MLSDNQAEYTRKKSRGVPRQGTALLHGIVYCSECGHKMHVQYKASRNNDTGRYVCSYHQQRTGGSPCQSITSAVIDNQVIQWFFEALSPSEIDISQSILKQCDQERATVLLARTQQVERLRYEAGLAERQFMKSDPDNRLVTGELERRWEVSLRELKSAEEELYQDEQSTAQYIIPADLLEQLEDVGRSLPQLWESGLLSLAQKKSLLRTLVDKVVLRRVDTELVSVRVVWRGGATSGDCIALSARRSISLSDFPELQSAVEQLASVGHSDQEIATTLTSQGYRSPKSDTVLVSTVRTIRLSKGQLQQPERSYPRNVPGFLSVSQMAKKLGVRQSWIHARIRSGTIQVEKNAELHCYLFPDTPDQLAKLERIVTDFQSNSGFSQVHHDA